MESREHVPAALDHAEAAPPPAQRRPSIASIAFEAAVVAGLLAAAGFLFSRSLDTATSRDEGEFLAAMDALRHGQTLGSEVFASQPPGFYVLLRIPGLWADSVHSARLFFLFVALLGCAAAYAIGRSYARLYGGAAAVAALALAPVLAGEAVRVDSEVPAASLATVALALSVYGFRPRAHLAPPLLAGAALAAAGSIEPLALAVAVGIAAVAVRPPRRALAAFGAGAAAVVVALIGAYAGVLGELWEDAGAERWRERRYEGQGADRLLHLIRWDEPFGWVLPLGAALALAAALRRPLRVWPLWSWTAAVLVLVGVLQRPLYAPDLVLLAVPLALALGISLSGAAPVVLHGKTLAFAGVSAAVIVGLGWAQQVRQADYAVGTEPSVISWGTGELERCTKPADLVPADLPIVAFRAHRRVPGDLVEVTRFRFGRGSLTPGGVMETLKRYRVRAVYAAQGFERNGQLAILLGARYEHSSTYPDGTAIVYGCSAAPSR
jgi:hypothetical protein